MNNETRGIIPRSLFLLTLICLTGCDSLGLRDYFANDQVPQASKDLPRQVQTAPPQLSNEGWPRLGDVPSKPKDFSPKPVYDHYMDELTYDRTQAQVDKTTAQQQDIQNNRVPQASNSNAAPPPSSLSPSSPLGDQSGMPQTSVGQPVLMPPQFMGH